MLYLKKGCRCRRVSIWVISSVKEDFRNGLWQFSFKDPSYLKSSRLVFSGVNDTAWEAANFLEKISCIKDSALGCTEKLQSDCALKANDLSTANGCSSDPNWVSIPKEVFLNSVSSDSTHLATRPAAPRSPGGDIGCRWGEEADISAAASQLSARRIKTTKRGNLPW